MATKKNKPYDEAFKYLAEQDAEALLLLLGEIEPGEKVEIVPLSRELRISTRLPDQAYKVVTASGERIVHIEAQARYPHVMPDRMADYGTREWMQYQLPVACYVLLLTDQDLPKHPPTFGKIDAGDVQITVHYRLVRLSQISASSVLELKRDHLLPFVPLMRGEQKDLVAGARRLRTVRLERQRSELGLHFLTLGALRYNTEDLLDLIGRESMIPLEVLKQSPAYDFLINEGKDRWREEGIEVGREVGREEGREEGLAEGEINSAAEMLRLLIARRFPRMKVSQKIKRLRDAVLLRQLGLEVIEVKDAAELRKRLDEAIKSQAH